jgi:hypothetical protein
MELGRRRIAALVAAFATQQAGLEVHLLLSDVGLESGKTALMSPCG